MGKIDALPVFNMLNYIDDPIKAEIIKDVGDISQVEVMYNYVLLGIYVRPEKTQSGLYLADTTRKEDVYQGKTGLVLKVGPTAFVDGPDMDFAGQNVQVGDWIVLRPGDGWQVKVGKRDCRMVPDTSIKLKVPKPDMIY